MSVYKFPHPMDEPETSGVNEKRTARKRRAVPVQVIYPAQNAVSVNETPGKVYFVSGGDLVKIGWATRPSARMSDMQMHCPVKLTLLLEVPGSGRLEKMLHNRFAASRRHGEWFRPTPEMFALIEEWRTSPPAPPLWRKPAIETYEPRERRRPFVD